jgi:hypothetical protein
MVIVTEVAELPSERKTKKSADGIHLRAAGANPAVLAKPTAHKLLMDTNQEASEPKGTKKGNRE